MAHKFILPPANDTSAMTVDIEAALEMFRTLLNVAVADSADPMSFRTVSASFQDSCDNLGLKLGIAGVNNPEFCKQAWWFNLSAIGLTATGITAQAIQQQLDSLRPAELTSRLAFQPDLQGRGATQLLNYLNLAVSAVLEELWWFLSDTTLEGIKVQSAVVQERNAVDHSFGAGCMFSSLNRDFPLPGTEDESDGYNRWRYNIYRLTLQLLGYQPTS